MSLRPSRRQRGTTIIELMSVFVILGLLMSMFVGVFAPMLRAQNRSAAKLDTVQSAAAALYRIQRDLRQTYYKSAYACTTGATASCSQPASFSTTTPAIALMTAYKNGVGAFQITSSGSNVGQPNWQGVTVYWIDSAGTLHWAFYRPTSGQVFPQSGQYFGLQAATAAAAVAAATSGGVSNTQIAVNVQQLSAAFSGQANIISVQMKAQSTENGSTNETTYRSDVLARQ